MLPDALRAARHRARDDDGLEARIAAELNRRVRVAHGSLWSGTLSEAERKAFRERGEATTRLLLRSLYAPRPIERERLLVEVEGLGRAYGEDAHRKGLALGEAVGAFLLYRADFARELARIARARALQPVEAEAFFAQAKSALDRVLVGLTAPYRAAAHAA